MIHRGVQGGTQGWGAGADWAKFVVWWARADSAPVARRPPLFSVIGGELQVTTDDAGWFALDQLAGLRHVDLVEEGLPMVGLTLPAQ